VATSISQRVTDVVVGDKAGSKRKRLRDGADPVTNPTFLPWWPLTESSSMSRVNGYRQQVHGRVQGVAFREYTRRRLFGSRLSGWVRNQTDGTVETVFEGPAEQVDASAPGLASGSPYARVDVSSVLKRNRWEKPVHSLFNFY
jgi:acylphosphatase